jgi:hypothetical protein
MSRCVNARWGSEGGSEERREEEKALWNEKLHQGLQRKPTKETQITKSKKDEFTFMKEKAERRKNGLRQEGL